MLNTGDSGFVSAWLRQEIREREYRKALARVRSMSFDTVADQNAFQPRSLLLAEIHRWLAEVAEARDEYEKARDILERELDKRPEDSRLHSALGIAYAGLMRKEDAIREAKRGLELMPPSKDALYGSAGVESLARVLTKVGEYDLAFDQLESLLSVPGYLSVKLIEIDPVWDPLREHPRYRLLLEKFGR